MFPYMRNTELAPPKLNTLDADEEVAYADTSVETWQIIWFFREQLRPVKIEDIEPESRTCDICTEGFTDSHRALRLPCNHIFGEPCIKKWFTPFSKCVPVAEERPRPEGANSCPNCRREFFPEQSVADSLPAIETRIKLWDKAYASVGIELSNMEHWARDDILRYLGSYAARGDDDYYPYITPQCPYPDWAHRRLQDFSVKLKHKSLTPLQERLRQSLELLATNGFPGGSTWRLNGVDRELNLEVHDG
ncbi:hypothetical protein MMC22_004387 [Lobaria immixta]|nr:hypothetical protein [Lobaria immixta]